MKSINEEFYELFPNKTEDHYGFDWARYGSLSPSDAVVSSNE